MLAAFSAGRSSALVVDVAHSGAHMRRSRPPAAGAPARTLTWRRRRAGTVVSAVHDGYALTKTTVRSPLGGAALSRLMLGCVEAAGAAVRPRFAFKRKARDGGGFDLTDVDTAGVTSSYRLHKQLEIAADIKESVGRLAEAQFREEDYANKPSAPYELPDGNTIEVALERYRVPELLFAPGQLAALPRGAEALQLPAGAPPLKSLTDMAHECLNKRAAPQRRTSRPLSRRSHAPRAPLRRRAGATLT